MYFLTDDTWAIILVRLPLKSITTLKLVCKQWKSLVESKSFSEFFLYHHQNSHSSWSLLCDISNKEVVANYSCEIWGLTRSLGSYISSFLTEKFENEKENVRVHAYSDVGLILICLRHRTYYVANPISQQCVELPPLPLKVFRSFGIFTRIENDLSLGYKVVLIMDTDNFENVLKLVIYSSESGLWTSTTPQHPLSLRSIACTNPVSLNGILYLLSCNLEHKQVIVVHDFFATDHQWRSIVLPDVDEDPNYSDTLTASKGFLMYMKLPHKRKLKLWRLKSGEWQKVYEMSTNIPGYFPLAINPFDADTMYLWSFLDNDLLSTNKIRIHNNSLKVRSDRSILSYDREWSSCSACFVSMFVLPRWLYRIPS